MSSKIAQKTKARPTRLPKGEAEQVRIRKEIGHDFALKDDRFGRKRLAKGTQEAARLYEVSSLSRQQREAGMRYRQDFRSSSEATAKPMAWAERVDGGRTGSGVAEHILSAGRDHAEATRALVHWEIAGIVQKVCCADATVKSLAEQAGEPRDVVVKLLKIGLDILAVHYGMMLMRKPR
ncbi:DUF6456 domain-containing protein [Mesorhizobium sp. M1339]|uniref:DUF6456 domain-containing protein n=1 Tax=Mesorhizobium sp. M1339 TaxID=2957086 RepID=UPI00333AB7E8